jgi:hypothetical protein
MKLISFVAVMVFTAVLAVWAQRPVDQFDVQPVSVAYGEWGHTVCDQGCVFVPISPEQAARELKDGGKPHRRERWTCADGRRFLMTSEDNVRHCLMLK